jgi:hypothetical protein
MWLLPTRNRPDAAQELLEAMIETGDVPEVAVMVDGPPYDMVWPAHWKIHQSPRHLEMGRALNALYGLYPDEPWYGLLTDHSRPETEAWSERMVEAVRPYGMVFANDTKNRMHPQTRKRRVTSASVYGGALVRACGWVWLDAVTHMYGDDAWEAIGHELEIIEYLPDVTVRDLLVREGEIPRDGNHRRLYRGRPYVEEDRRAYSAWLKDEFPALIEGLRETHQGSGRIISQVA